MEKNKCCICGSEFEGFGNNPDPIKRKGRCCNACNYLVLIERIKLIQSHTKKDLEIGVK